MTTFEKLLVNIELHSLEGISSCFSEGIDPNDTFGGKPLIYELIGEYTRSPEFKKCVQVFVDHGLRLEDKTLLAILLDDAEELELLLNKEPDLVNNKYSLRCAYTPLFHASLLHICAEFNHLECAKVLIKSGLDINVKAGTDENGFGGQTPIFHTVNQNSNQSVELLNYLLSQDADLKITIAGVIWGKGYDWETLIPAVNPVSYTMMGLLPQMHRDEITITKTVSVLLKKGYGINYEAENVPCKYLMK